MENFFGEINRALDRNLTPAVKRIFVINVIVGLILIILVRLTNLGYDLVWLFGLNTRLLLKGCIWQFITYMFLHVAPFHLLFNMLVLWFFGPDLENRWGTRRFWQFYLTVGGVAGVLHLVIAVFVHMVFNRHYEGLVIGASGALYGVMLAFAAYNPEAMVLFWGVFPIKVKYLVAILIFMEFLFTASPGESNVSSLTHLLGLGVAYVFLAQYHRDWDIRRWRWRR